MRHPEELSQLGIHRKAPGRFIGHQCHRGRAGTALPITRGTITSPLKSSHFTQIAHDPTLKDLWTDRESILLGFPPQIPWAVFAPLNADSHIILFGWLRKSVHTD